MVRWKVVNFAVVFSVFASLSFADFSKLEYQSIDVTNTVVRLDTHIHTLFSNETGNDKYIDFDHLNAPSLGELPSQLKACDTALIVSDHAENEKTYEWNQMNHLSDQSEGWFSPPLISGFEWTCGGVVGADYQQDFAHIVVTNCDKPVATKCQVSNCASDEAPTLEEFYNWIDDNAKQYNPSEKLDIQDVTVMGFAHPWIGKYQFDDFKRPESSLSYRSMAWIEIAGGPMHEDVEHGIDFYFRALQKGWIVAPAYGSDNFGPIEKTETFGGVWVDLQQGTKRSKLLNSIFARRMYVSEVPEAYFDWSISYGVPDELINEVKMGGEMSFSSAGVGYYGFGDVPRINIYLNNKVRPLIQKVEIWVITEETKKCFDLEKLADGKFYKYYADINDGIMAIVCTMKTYPINGKVRWIVGAPIFRPRYF